MPRKDSPRSAASQENARSADPIRQSRRRRRLLLLLVGVGVVVGSLMLRNQLGDPQANAQSWFGFGKSDKEEPKKETATPASASQSEPAALRPQVPDHDIMAIVNGKDLNRAQLAHACVERFGEEVLESLVNKRLILHHCQKRGIEVTQEEIAAEIDRMAKRFKLGREQWLDLLEKERGIGRQEYTRDILWPTLALKKIAADRLVVSEQELAEAHEMQFGPAVRARLLVVSDREKAEQLHRQIVERPDEFARLAMNFSEDVNSASIGGMIRPIRKHMGDPTIEEAVFALRPGEVSQIIPVAEQFVILKCEEHLARQPVTLEEVREELTEQIRERKLRDAASGLFADFQRSAAIQNVWNDPELRDQMPGIVATVNGGQITMQQLGDECLLRYGKEVLEIEISHMLLQQALRTAGLTVTQDDINQEVAHAAVLAGIVDAQGQPDYDEWFRVATEEQGVTKSIYLRDSVWPSAALKKLTGDNVVVSEKDMKKAFAANYGPRVRCRAIVLHNMRTAMEVWGKARENPSMEYFSQLATEYSIDATGKSLGGEWPPIRHFGGSPQLEEAAFALQPAQLSEIIQVSDHYVILKCEGYTKPIEVKADEVDHVLRQDILEKKLRLAMAEKYDQIREQAQIDNYLAGTSQTPTSQQTGDARSHYDTAVRPTSGATQR